jgi:Fur family ferric uptake transcriptional regulator
MNREQQFKTQLRSAGERVTTARLAIYRVLLRHSPLSMPKLLEKVREDGIDTVTCYRTLDLFRKLGLAQDVGLGRNRLIELTDDSYIHHHHVWCTVCGKVTDFDSPAIEEELARVSQKLGVKISSHQLEAYGVCASCLAKA